MKIDCSKISNKTDFIMLAGIVLLLCVLCLVAYLAATNNSFIAGFVAATFVWKWKSWIYEPIDRLAERHWPFKG